MLHIASFIRIFGFLQCYTSRSNADITRTTEYFDEIQYNRNSVKCEHFENLISMFRLSYSHHQEVNDDIITYVQVYIEVTRYGLVKY